MTDTAFRDMKCRVRNEGKCPMRFLNAKPGCWPYGELLFVCNADELTATFGDLTIPLNTASEVAQLVALADGQHHRFTQDLEWRWESDRSMQEYLCRLTEEGTNGKLSRD